MKFKEKLIDNVIEPHSKSIFTTSVGEVINYNIYKNTADISVENIKDSNKTTFSNVPVQIIGDGIRLASLESGDKVYVQFSNGSIFQPKIIGVADEFYRNFTREKQRHIREGSLLSNIVKDDREIVQKSSDTWIDCANKDKSKYKDFMNINPIKSLIEKIEGKGYFIGKEVGIYHPDKSSIVKISEDGSIDIFISTNIGVRVNTKNKTIEFFGDVSTKSENWSVISNSIKICAEDKITLCGSKISIDAEKIEINGVEKNV